MELGYEWDENKAAINLIKHRVSFTLAVHVFNDAARIDRYDGREAYGENRYVTIGLVGTTEFVVTYTMRDDTCRLISARKAERHERSEYWKNR